MYVRNMRNGLLDQYAFAKGLCARKSPTIFDLYLVFKLNIPSVVLIQASCGSNTLTTTRSHQFARASPDLRPNRRFKMRMLLRMLIFHPAR